ncbi:YozQ family protein [Paenibacillus alkalitolerans]|uniref:YozQ family protein n=1 Tax=Paenibacillus alkalitolerans TaxID=2799335 RepID=UPI0018F58D5C|nr:YozQ family protein [Paenibacillus alkalitolerans]
MSENESKAPYPSEQLADEALKRNFSGVAGTNYDLSEKTGSSAVRQGLQATHEQISDDYFAGGNEAGFLRDGKDLAKDDGFAPKK